MALPTRLAATPTGPVEYRLTGTGSRTVLVLHGGHLSAAVPLGERDLLDLGLRILAVSRPGYGRTPVATARTRTDFGDVVAQLCGYLGIDRLAAIVGMSHGGPSAVALAAGHPELVERLILESAVSSLPWPGPATRLGARVALNYRTALLTWRLSGALARRAPDVFLRTMLRALSTGSGSEVLADLGPADRVAVLDLLTSMQASHGFLHDLREPVDPGLEARVRCPTLIIATHEDGQVPPRHAEHLLRHIHGATLIWSHAPSHLIWFGSSARERTEHVTRFLAEAPERGGAPLATPRGPVGAAGVTRTPRLRGVDPHARRGRLYLALCRLSVTPAGAWLAVNLAWKLDRRLLTLTGGRFSSAWPVAAALLETRGARTGAPRRTATLYFHDGDRVTIVAALRGWPRHPAWYYNLRANPEVVFGGLPFRAEIVEDEGERRRLWDLADRVYPQYADFRERAAQAGRVIPIVQLARR
jgi:deazaflavin-dependent oxidoreductase (nitroreductase family)